MIVDAAIVAGVGFFVWRGLRRGLIATLANFAGFLVAVAAAVFGYPVVAVPLRAAGLSDGVANLAGALVVFIGVMLGASFAARALTRAMRFTKWGAINAAAGGTLSGLWALSIVTVVLLATTVIPLSEGMASELEESAIARAIIEESPAWMDTIARTDLRSMLRFFAPEQRKVSIVATDEFRWGAAAERALFDLVNAERRARGVSELRWDESLASVARRHAAEMYRTGFFSHVSPLHGGPRQRYVLGGVRFGAAGENLVLAPGVAPAHALLMDSPEHRDHIVDGGYRRIGLGVMIGRQGLLVAQNFAD